MWKTPLRSRGRNGIWVERQSETRVIKVIDDPGCSAYECPKEAMGIHKHYIFKGGQKVNNHKRYSIVEMCLCHRCASVFLYSKAYRIKRINPLEVIKSECDHCRTGEGHDYYIST